MYKGKYGYALSIESLQTLIDFGTENKFLGVIDYVIS